METPSSPATIATSASTTTTSAPALTAAERARLIDAASATMTPEMRKPKPVDPVKAWLPQIRRKHRQGYSLRQIVAILASPGIGIKTSRRSLQRLIGATPAPKKKPSAGKN